MSKFVRDHRGGVTVFITLILIPSVLFISIFLELAIYKAAAPHNGMRLQGESTLSNYNGLLKDTYGLFAVSHGEQRYRIGLMSDYMYSPGTANGEVINNQLSDKGFFNPFRNYNRIALDMFDDNPRQYSLNNSEVLQTQISEYMKYRAAATFFSDIGSPTGLIEQLGNLQNDSEAINSKAKLDKEIESLNKNYELLHGYMMLNDTFDRDVRTNAVKVLNEGAVIIAESAARILELEAELEGYKEAKARHSCPWPPDPDHSCPNYSSEIRQCESGISDCKKTINTAADAGRAAISSVTELMTQYQKNVDPSIKTIINKIAGQLAKIQLLKDTHIAELGEASADLQQGLKEELAQYDEVLKDPPDIRTVFTDIEGNFTIAKDILDEYSSLTCGGVSWSVLSSSNATATSDSYEVDGVSWKYYRQTHPRLLAQLDKWYGKVTTDSSGKAAGKKATGKLEGDMGSLQDKMLPTSNPSPRGAAGIPEQYASYLASAKSKSPTSINKGGLDLTEGLSDNVAQDTSSGNLFEVSSMLTGMGDMAMNGLHKVLLVEYQLGVFSHSTTGKDGSDKESVEEGITGIPKSPRLNYMYGSELEYLYAGGMKTWENQLASRGTMMGILFVRDFAVSYSHKALNKEIDVMGTAFAAGNPMVAIATKLALRGLVTGVESGDELYTLLQGESIDIIKNKNNWKYSLTGLLEGVVDEVVGEIKEEITGSDDSKPSLEFTINYEQFMRFLLLAMVNRETLLGRTQDLIMLNMDNYETSGSMPAAPLNHTSYMVTSVNVESTNKVGFLTQVNKTLGLEGIDGEAFVTNYRISY